MSLGTLAPEVAMEPRRRRPRGRLLTDSARTALGLLIAAAGLALAAAIALGKL